MVKLFSAALVLTALTVPVSMSNLGTSDDTVETEQQFGSNPNPAQEPQQQQGFQPQSPTNLNQESGGTSRFPAFHNPATVQLAEYPGNQDFQNPNSTQENGSGFQPQFENPSQVPPTSQPKMGLTPLDVNQLQAAIGSQNSLREPPASADWQRQEQEAEPQFQPSTNPAFQNEFQRRFQTNDLSAVPELREPPRDPSTAANNYDSYYNPPAANPVQDRSVIQAGWEQQPVGDANNGTILQSLSPTGQGNRLSGVELSAAKNILEQLEQFSQSQSMPGTPLTLEEALHQTSPELRARMVASYWQAWRDRFLVTSAEMKLMQLEEIDRSGAFGMQGTLAQQVRNAENDLISRRLALKRSQSELKQFFSALVNAEYSPLPVDMPVTGGYDTHYGWYANNGQGTAELKSLDESLPMILELVLEHSDTALKMSRSADRLLQLATTGQATLDQLVSTLDRSQQTTGNCLESLRQYNATIGDYSIALRPDIASSFDLAKMLVPGRRTTSVNVDTQPARTADLRVNVPAQPASNSQQFSNGDFSSSSRNSNQFDSSDAGATFQPLALPGSGNHGPAAQTPGGGGTMPTQLIPISPVGQSGFSQPSYEGGSNPASQPLRPQTFQNPGEQRPPTQFGSGG